MLRKTVVNLGTVVPRAGSVAFLHLAPINFSGSSVYKRMGLKNLRLMSTNSESSKNSKIVHDMVHFKTSTNAHPLGVEKLAGDKQVWTNPMQHSVWTDQELNSVQKTHVAASGVADMAALTAVKLARWGFDTFSLYKFGKLTPDKVLNRAIFLETVAGVPGMCAGMLRHLRSLRRMDRDHGWIHTLLEEAENERMHLLTFVKLKQPGPVFRTSVMLTQGVFMNFFFVAYLISPTFCHRFVGYLEEEAVKTYSDILRAIDDGPLMQWNTTPAPQIAIDYWKMREDATMRDLILAVRADEANHRDVNHTLAGLRPDQVNPFVFEHVLNADKKKAAHATPATQSSSQGSEAVAGNR